MTDRTAERTNPHEKWLRKLAAELQSATPPTTLCTVQTVLQAANEIGRLQETVTFPTLTPDAPTEQFAKVLRDHEKGQPVNGQDLINALMWRVRNQRREISRLNEALRRKASDEAPSFSPNFDERNGIR